MTNTQERSRVELVGLWETRESRGNNLAGRRNLILCIFSFFQLTVATRLCSVTKLLVNRCEHRVDTSTAASFRFSRVLVGEKWSWEQRQSNLNVESCSCGTIQLSFSGNVFLFSATVSIHRLSREHDHPYSPRPPPVLAASHHPPCVGLGRFSRLFWSIVSLLRAALLLLGCGVKAHLRGDTGCCTRPPLHGSSFSLVKAPCPCSLPHGPPKCHRFLVFRVPRRSRHRCGQHPRTDRLAVRCLQNCSPHPAPQGICLLKFLCSVSHPLSSAAVPT